MRKVCQWSSVSMSVAPFALAKQRTIRRYIYAQPKT